MVSKSKNSIVTVSLEDGESQDSYPRILSFPGGAPETTLSLTVGSKGTGRKRKRQIVTEVGGMPYKGVDYGSTHTHKNDLCKFAVCKVDKETGKMVVYPSPHLYVMRPQSNKPSLEPPTHSGLSLEQRRNALTEDFGSRKKKRALAQAESNKIVDENITGAGAVESVLKDSVVQSDNATHVDASLYALEQNRKLLLPPYNRDTISPAEAYPMHASEDGPSNHALIPAVIFEDMEAWYESLLPEDIADVKAKKYIATASAAIVANLEQAAVQRLTLVKEEAGAAAAAEEGQEMGEGGESAMKVEPAPAVTISGPEISAEDVNPAFAVLVGIKEAARVLMESMHSPMPVQVEAVMDEDGELDDEGTAPAPTPAAPAMNKQEANEAFQQRVICYLYMNVILKTYQYFTKPANKFMSCEKEALLMYLGAQGQDALIDAIVSQFCTSKKNRGVPQWSWTKQSIDKITAYILALGHHGSGYSLHLGAVASSMNLPTTNLVKIARTMGGRVTTGHGANADSVMRLSLPLSKSFPGKPRMQKAKR